MGQIKKLLQDAIERGYAYSKDYDYDYYPQLVEEAVRGRKILRNDELHMWHEDMPDMMGEELRQAQEEFDFNVWVQLELDLWENKMGYGGECDL